MKTERNQAWRRFQASVHKGNGMGSNDKVKPEKNWKQLYFRSEKLARAKQLGFEYPRKPLYHSVATNDEPETHA